MGSSPTSGTNLLFPVMTGDPTASPGSMDPSPVRLSALHPLGSLTAWQIGGPAAQFAEPSTPTELRWCLQWAESNRLPVLALGGGSNLLIADAGYPGLVLRYVSRAYGISASGPAAQVEVGAFAPLAGTARRLARQGWAGLEWAEGIPGTVGGAVVGNAGAYGGEIATALAEVETLSLAHGGRTIPGSDCAFGYRGSRFHGQDPTREFILSARFRLRKADPEELEERLDQIGRERRARTPVGRSCGSVFKNPPGDAAGRLIEAAGFKGIRQGAAQVSPKHANYILNLGGATARDVLSLIESIREKVRREFGVDLELEVQLIGF